MQIHYNRKKLLMYIFFNKKKSGGIEKSIANIHLQFEHPNENKPTLAKNIEFKNNKTIH